MTKFIYRSDLAVDLREEKDFCSHHIYEKEVKNDILIEKVILQEDDKTYQKKKGCYISLSFKELYKEETRKDLISNLSIQLKEMMCYLKVTDPKKVLVCGLGNMMLSCDSLGPLLQDQLIVNAHLEDVSCRVALFIPRVKAQTGIETFDLINSTIQTFQPDLVIVVDALATKSLQKVNQVIQLSSAGIQPGSGVGNHTKALNSQSLQVPLISLGVPTVVDCASIAYDVFGLIENYFASQIQIPHEKLKVGKREVEDLKLNDTQKEMLLGMIGTLDEKKQRQLFEEVISPTSFNMIVMDKDTDIQIQQLAKIIAHALNEVFISK